MIGTVSLRQQLKQRRKLESSARGPAAAGVTWVLLKMLGQTRWLNQPKNVYLTSKDDETCGFYQQLNVYSTSFIATKTCRTSWIQPENMIDSMIFTVKMASEATKRLGLKTKSREFADCPTIRSFFKMFFWWGIWWFTCILGVYTPFFWRRHLHEIEWCFLQSIQDKRCTFAWQMQSRGTSTLVDWCWLFSFMTNANSMHT